MALLSKRKSPAEPAISQEDANEIFRRHFEAQFKPLEVSNPGPSTSGGSDDHNDDEDEDSEVNRDGDAGGNGEESEWGGLSDDEVSPDEDDHKIEVVDYSSQALTTTAMSKRELKAFMSSRPPDQTTPLKEPATDSKPSSTSLPEDAPSLLAQDLELRRLIAESHLLTSKSATSLFSAPAAPKTFAAGRTHQKATDMRIQALGSKTSIFKQEKMPMSMRRGMAAAADARETKRRREAKENGIVLERGPGKKRKGGRSRDGGGVDRPGVGRLRGAQLSISERDVRQIEGTRDTFGRRGGKR